MKNLLLKIVATGLLLILHTGADAQTNKHPKQQVIPIPLVSFGMSMEKELWLNVQWDNHSANVKIKYRFCGQGNNPNEAKENLKSLAKTQFNIIRAILLRDAPKGSSSYTILNSSDCPYPLGVYFGGDQFAVMVVNCSSPLPQCGPGYITCVNAQGRPCWPVNKAPKENIR